MLLHKRLSIRFSEGLKGQRGALRPPCARIRTPGSRVAAVVVRAQQEQFGLVSGVGHSSGFCRQLVWLQTPAWMLGTVNCI